MNNSIFTNDIIYYIVCALLSCGVLLGIKLMSKVEKANLGNQISALCMLIAVAVTLLRYDILNNYVLWLGMLLGTGVGVYLVATSKMMLMPQLVALLNGVGGLASTIAAALVLGLDKATGGFESISAALALAVGAFTFSGSLIAAGKLHRLLPQKPVTIFAHSPLTILSLFVMLALVFIIGLDIKQGWFMLILFAIVSLGFGVLFAVRVGGADMPITISLLNSTSGLAAAIAGMAIRDILLVSVGAIVGASGLLLTQIMCRAMNRSLSGILFAKKQAVHIEKAEEKSIENNAVNTDEKAIPSKEDTKVWLDEAKDIIIVPGYGMAISQAQGKLKELAGKLESKGKQIRYAIHPVAGRMPGHMNVLLAEVDVPYDALYEMEAIDGDFESCDLAIVVGANDVLNPAANTAEGTPIYGMPVLSVEKAKRAIICNFDDKPGYAGVPNPLYEPNEKIILMFGDAKESLDYLIAQL